MGIVPCNELLNLLIISKIRPESLSAQYQDQLNVNVRTCSVLRPIDGLRVQDVSNGVLRESTSLHRHRAHSLHFLCARHAENSPSTYRETHIDVLLS